MRFEVSRVLDAIEQRLCTDPVLAGAVVNIGELLRAAELDGGRAAYLPRLGAVIDALATKLDDAAVPVYAVAERDLLSSLELTSNEKMVLRRWADGGLIEVLADADLNRRLIEVATITGLPVLTRSPLSVPMAFTPVPGVGGVTLIERRGPSPEPAPETAVLNQNWRCPDGEQVPVPLLFATGQPTCPRHGLILINEGVRPPAVAVTVWVEGVAKCRFSVDASNPVVVGRSPAKGIMLGPWLDDESLQWISRSHVELSMVDDVLTVTDKSTNGTVVFENGRRVELLRERSHPWGKDDIVELYRGVELTKTGRRPSRPSAGAVGIMAEAPTIAIRLDGAR
jgi:hypothetical protein